MSILNENEWQQISKILLDLYSETNSHDMRFSFMQSLRHLIVYNIGEFSIGSNNDKFSDYIEVNMDDDKPIHFLDKYFEYRTNYGNRNIDWIFSCPESTVMRVEDIFSGEVYEESNFNRIYLKSINMKHCCTSSLVKNKKYLGEFSLYLGDGYGEFTDRDIYILNVLKNHVCNKLYDLSLRRFIAPLTPLQKEGFAQFLLTEREFDVLSMILDEKTYESITHSLFISLNTLKKHIGNIFKKLDVHSRSELCEKCYNLLREQNLR